jgi:hypothetical protein
MPPTLKKPVPPPVPQPKKYAPKRQYEEEEYKPEYKHEESYAPKKPSYYPRKEKVSVKLYEKFRSHLRPQPGNVNTFQFT